MRKLLLACGLILSLAGCSAQDVSSHPGDRTSHPTATPTSPSPTPGIVVAVGHGWTQTPPAELGPTWANGACHTRTASNGQPLPDEHCTPGATDSAVTQATIRSTICVTGYTATVRPPVSITSRYKLLTKGWYGQGANLLGEYDHLIPLELGGASDTRNLWVEPGSIPNAKDKVENRLKAAVCSGAMKLRAAQLAITTDWTRA